MGESSMLWGPCLSEHRREQIPYPLIAMVTRMPQTLLGRCPISIRTRTFETIVLSFSTEQSASDVFDSIKDLTVSRACAFYSFREPVLTVLPQHPSRSFTRSRMCQTLPSPSTTVGRYTLHAKSSAVWAWAHARKLGASRTSTKTIRYVQDDSL